MSVDVYRAKSVSQSIFAENYIAAVLRKTLETYTELDQVAFVV